MFRLNRVQGRIIIDALRLLHDTLYYGFGTSPGSEITQLPHVFSLKAERKTQK